MEYHREGAKEGAAIEGHRLFLGLFHKILGDLRLHKSFQFSLFKKEIIISHNIDLIRYDAVQTG